MKHYHCIGAMSERENGRYVEASESRRVIDDAVMNWNRWMGEANLAKSILFVILADLGVKTFDAGASLVDVSDFLRDLITKRFGNLPANWNEDASLETWFPITAMAMEQLKAEKVDILGDLGRANSRITQLEKLLVDYQERTISEMEKNHQRDLPSLKGPQPL